MTTDSACNARLQRLARHRLPWAPCKLAGQQAARKLNPRETAQNSSAFRSGPRRTCHMKRRASGCQDRKSLGGLLSASLQLRLLDIFPCSRDDFFHAHQMLPLVNDGFFSLSQRVELRSVGHNSASSAGWPCGPRARSPSPLASGAVEQAAANYPGAPAVQVLPCGRSLAAPRQLIGGAESERPSKRCKQSHWMWASRPISELAGSISRPMSLPQTRAIHANQLVGGPQKKSRPNQAA